ncbi:MAG: LytR/AlgR family response regulator transcription factor [Pseudomonadales bacterium]
MTSALLVDDEPTLSAFLARQLARVWPELEILGTAVNGRQALSMAEELAPDIVFLDIRMPGLSGLDVARSLDPEIRIVFVTAYDDYAVEAFDAAAVDYLLKPVETERLAQTVSRLKLAAGPADRERVAAAIARLSPDDGHLRWLRSQQGDATRLIPVETVVYFKSGDKYTSVVTPTEEHLIRTSLRGLEAELDPAVFWRVHRGLIVRVEEILEARRDLKGRYTLTLRSRPERLRTSQKYGYRFRGM